MGTKIRSEVSRKREYWLPKHRQLELVHFVSSIRSGWIVLIHSTEIRLAGDRL